MKRIFTQERPGAIVLLLGVWVLVVFLSGCMSDVDQLVYTGAIIEVEAPSTNLQGGGQSDEYSDADDYPPNDSSEDPSAGNDGEGGEATSPVSPPTEEELSNCPGGLKAKMIEIDGAKTHLRFQASEPVILIVTGEKSHVHMKVRSETPIAGLCFVFMADKVHLKAKLMAEVKQAHYLVRANKTHGKFKISQGGRISGPFTMDISGSKNHLHVHGGENSSCPVGPVTGEDNKIKCH